MPGVEQAKANAMTVRSGRHHAPVRPNRRNWYPGVNPVRWQPVKPFRAALAVAFVALLPTAAAADAGPTVAQLQQEQLLSLIHI